jgi:hypothetical protein
MERKMMNAFERIDQLRKRDPGRKISESDWAQAKYEEEVEKLEKLYSSDAEYWSMRRDHDQQIEQLRKSGKVSSGRTSKSAAPGTLRFAQDPVMESQVEELRREVVGDPTVYEAFSYALDQAANQLEERYPDESHAQRVGRLLDDERVQRGWSAATTIGRSLSYEEAVSSVNKSDEITSLDLTLDVIDWLTD